MVIDLYESKSVISFELTNRIEFRMADTDLSDVDFKELCDYLKKHPTLEALTLKKCLITDERLPVLVELLKEMPNFQYLNLGGNDLTDAATPSLISLMEEPGTLSELLLFDTKLTRNSSALLAEAYGRLPHMVSLRLTGSIIPERESAELLTHHIMKGRNKNFAAIRLQASSRTAPELTAFANANMDRAFTAIRSLIDDAGDLTTDTIHQSYFRLPLLNALTHQMTTVNRSNLSAKIDEIKTAVDQYKELLDSLPIIDPKADARIIPGALVARGAGRYAPLDNPKIWQDFPAICKKLAKQGTPLTLETLQRQNHDGVTYLESAIRNAPLDKLMDGLRHSGICLRGKQLLTGTLEASPLLNALIEREERDGFFTEQNWKGVPAQELKAIIRALPESQQSEISNRHALLANRSHPNDPSPNR